MNAEKTEEIVNPFDPDEVAEVLSNHKTSGHRALQEYSGMQMKTLCKRLDVDYWSDVKGNEYKIAKMLREHPNIENSDRAPLKYVPDEELERRAKLKKEREERERKKEENEQRLMEELGELHEVDERFTREDLERPISTHWNRFRFDDKYKLEVDIRGGSYIVKIEPDWGTDEKEVARYSPDFKVGLDSSEKFAGAIAAYEEMLHKVAALDGELRR